MSDLLSRYLPTAIAIIFLIILFVRTRQHRLAAEKIKNEIKNRYAGQTVFFCDNCEDLGKNLVQFYKHCSFDLNKVGKDWVKDVL